MVSALRLSLALLALACMTPSFVDALPSSQVGSVTLQHDKRGEELFNKLQERTPPVTWFQQGLQARVDKLQKRAARSPSPIAHNPVDLTAASSARGGENYTAYKNPVPAEFTRQPHYAAFSAFDFHSLNLATHQELIELDLFLHAANAFSQEDFKQAGLTSDDVSLLRFFGQQEIGHATVLSNLLGAKAPKTCRYEYPYTDVRSYLRFNEELTRWGESGVYGFLPSLDNRANAQILLQSIATEARQQYTFRQWLGLFPVPVWFESGIPQAWAWTLLSPYITSCPSHNVPVGFSIYPNLTVTNQRDIIQAGRDAGGPAISHNVSALSVPGQRVNLAWDAPGKLQGPYHQRTEILAADSTPRFAAFLAQYNVSYSALQDIKTRGNKTTAWTKLPAGQVLPGSSQSTINGTSFVAITNSDSFYTPLNLTLINGATIAGPAIFQAG